MKTTTTLFMALTAILLINIPASARGDLRYGRYTSQRTIELPGKVKWKVRGMDGQHHAPLQLNTEHRVWDNNKTFTVKVGMHEVYTDKRKTFKVSEMRTAGLPSLQHLQLSLQVGATGKGQSLKVKPSLLQWGYSDSLERTGHELRGVTSHSNSRFLDLSQKTDMHDFPKLQEVLTKVVQAPAGKGDEIFSGSQVKQLQQAMAQDMLSYALKNANFPGVERYRGKSAEVVSISLKK